MAVRSSRLTYKIAFVGVHGSGKTTTALALDVLLRRYGYSVSLVEIEAIDEVAGLDPISRQLYFISKYTLSVLYCFILNRVLYLGVLVFMFLVYRSLRGIVCMFS